MGLIPVVQPDITFINRISDFSQHFIEPFNVKGKKLTLNLNYSVQSKIATIKGYFSMISLNNSSKFRAYIPKTKLSHPEILN